MRPSPQADRRTELIAVAGLLVVTAIWGSTFVVVKHAVERMPVLDFLAWRFGIATVVMLALRPRALAGLGPAGRRAGLLLGLLLGLGYVAQTLGLQTTPASISGFITGMYVVLTPLIAGLLLRRPVGRSGWGAVALATAGLGLIALRGFSVGPGEWLTLGCAVAFALHIVGLGEWSGAHDPAGLAVLQLLSVTGLCAVAALAAGGLRPPTDPAVWGALALTSLAATAFGYWVQTWAQRHLPATRTAIVLTMEPVFAGVFGVLLGGDSLGARILTGAGLVIAAMLLAELGPRRAADATVERLEV